MAWHLPLGYEWIDGKIEIEERFAKLVVQIFTDFENGKSAAKIAKELTQKSMENGHGRTKWTHVNIGKILDNPLYVGTDEYKQIIENDLFHSVLRKREKFRAEYSRGKYRPNKELRELFGGTLVCGKCGAPYSYRLPPHKERKSETEFWKCKQQELRKNYICRNSYITDEQLKNVCIYAINQFVKDSRQIQKYKGKPQTCTREFWNIHWKLERTEDMNSEDALKLLFKRAEERYKTLEVRDEEIQSMRMENVIEEIREIETFDEGLYRKLIKKIYVHPNNIAEVIFHNKDSLKIGY